MLFQNWHRRDNSRIRGNSKEGLSDGLGTREHEGTRSFHLAIWVFRGSNCFFKLTRNETHPITLESQFIREKSPQAGRKIDFHDAESKTGSTLFDIVWNAKMEHFEVGATNFVTKDTNAVASAAGRFSLPQDSPAWKLGFRPILFEQIDQRKDAVRRRLDRMR